MLSRHDRFLRFLELSDYVRNITCGDRGFGDGTKRSYAHSLQRIGGGEGPGGDGSSGIDVLKVAVAPVV